MRLALSLLCCALLCVSCEEGDTPEPGVSYEIAVGDTLITIPAEAVNFAGTLGHGNHFVWDAYMLREYQVASNPNLPREHGVPYQGTLEQWKNTSWTTRRSFLVPPYDHNVTTTSPEAYYYMIGTYAEQFGYGWVDTYDPEANLWDSAVRPWLHPADSTLLPDNPGTIGFDGGLGDMAEYRAMWVVE
ncbi:MAG: hypothetical protein IPK53_18740 [bacterium]|nr:hypothetical protein [bacterium]